MLVCEHWLNLCTYVAYGCPTLKILQTMLMTLICSILMNPYMIGYSLGARHACVIMQVSRYPREVHVFSCICGVTLQTHTNTRV